MRLADVNEMRSHGRRLGERGRGEDPKSYRGGKEPALHRDVPLSLENRVPASRRARVTGLFYLLGSRGRPGGESGQRGRVIAQASSPILARSTR